MTWFAFAGSGSVYNLNGVAEKELVATGAHGYATEAQAEAHPNAPESPAQSALLAADQVSASLPVGGGLSGVQSGTTKAANPLSGAFSLTFGNTTGLLTRILKVVFGGILLIAGVLKLSGSGKTLEQVVPLVGGPAGKVLPA